MAITLAHIAAASENDVIGADGGLPWDIPEDMKFFRDKTKGKAIIMGRKTFESVGHPLPKRLNVVVTRQEGYVAEGATVFTNIDDAVSFCKTKTKEFGEEIFIIGGGEVYKQTLDIVDTIYLTRIHKEIKGDARYPKIDKDKFELVESSARTEPVAFTFLTYKKKS